MSIFRYHNLRKTMPTKEVMCIYLNKYHLPQALSNKSSHRWVVVLQRIFNERCNHIYDVFNFLIMHYDDVIMSTIASQITSLTIVYSTVYSGADQSKHQSSASLAFVWGIQLEPVNSPHKWPVTRKMFPFDDVIMCWAYNPLVQTLHGSPVWYAFCRLISIKEMYKRKTWYSGEIICLTTINSLPPETPYGHWSTMAQIMACLSVPNF